MPKQTKHWRIALAPTPAAADVQITLTSAQREDTGSRHHDRYGGTESALRRPVIRTTVRVGSYETELINTPTNMTWRGAAGDWWQDFAAWADRNTAAIRQQLTTDH